MPIQRPNKCLFSCEFFTAEQNSLSWETKKTYWRSHYWQSLGRKLDLFSYVWKTLVVGSTITNREDKNFTFNQNGTILSTRHIRSSMQQKTGKIKYNKANNLLWENVVFSGELKKCKFWVRKSLLKIFMKVLVKMIFYDTYNWSLCFS